MNKNKIIFAWIWIVIVVVFVFILKTLSAEPKSTSNTPKAGSFTLWTLDNSQEFTTYLQTFYAANEQYKDTQINVVGFENYTDYFSSLVGAVLTWRTPDIFVLNNNDGKYFDALLAPIGPEIIDIDTFRKNYDIIFSQDLIQGVENNGVKSEILRWVPMWYQILGTFYNFRDLRGENISTWSYLNDIASRFSGEWKILLGLGNGSFVESAADIFTQFLIQDDVKWFSSQSNGNALSSSLARYHMFGDEMGSNRFNSLSVNLPAWEKNIDAFGRGEVSMVFGYPRLLEKISSTSFSPSFLRAGNFPMYAEWSGSVLIDYNYFVINKATQNQTLAVDLMKYFASEAGQKAYLENVSYVFPSRLSLLQARLEEPLKDGYSVKYKDFYNSSFEYVTFNKANRQMYDQELIKSLDDILNGTILFENFRKRVLCISEKMITWENLVKSCEN